MSDEIITTTETTAIVPEVWSARFYEVLLLTLPYLGSVDRNYEGEVASLGDIVNISSIPEFDTASDLGEGVAGQAEAVTISGQQLTINKRPYKDFIITKKSLTQSLPFMDKVRDKAIFSIQKKMQADIITTISPSTAGPDHVIAYDGGSTLALADILEAKELLDTANVPMGDRFSVHGAAQWNDIFNITGFTSRDFIPAGSPLTSGDIPSQLAGFSPKFTTAVSSTSYFHHPTFMTMAIQQSMNIEVFNLGSDGVRGSRVNSDVLWGLKQLDSSRSVSIS